jgi:phosphotransacetylase
VAAAEPASGEVRYCVLGAIYTHSPADARAAVRQELLKFAAEGSTDQRFDVCMAMANAPTEDMVPTLEKLLDHKPADERTGAAYVLLRMGLPRDQADPNH